jgi:membrane protease YdiL (CAAX protease family)
MTHKKEITIQDIVFLILMLSYLLFSYYMKQQILRHTSNNNVIIGLLSLRVILAGGLSTTLLFYYKDFIKKQWNKFVYHSWVKYLWIILGWIGMTLVINLTRSVLHWAIDFPLIKKWDAISYLVGSNITGFTKIAELFLVLLNLLIIPFAFEVVSRHILFLKHEGDKLLMVLLGVVGLVIYGSFFYSAGESWVGCIPYGVAGIVLMLMYLQSKNIWYVVITSVLFNIIVFILSVFDSFLLSYIS